MKLALMAIALLLLGTGGLVLFSEGRALSQLENKSAGFANGDGFATAWAAQEFLQALASSDTEWRQSAIGARLAEMPFDPLLLGLKAEMLVELDVTASANLLDQATAIAPRDPRIQALRDGLQARLQNLPSPASPLAE